MTQDSFDKIEELLKKETAGDYDIKQLLGKGGMAVVYLAREVHLARNVAIKVLPPELTFGHGVERFKREAKTAAALDHPNIIPIYRVSAGGTLFWYAMKFLEGESLEQMLKDRGKIPLDLSLKILEQVADALDYAHDHQVVHRDMKPANVMLDSRNRVIVTDFGIAKALSEGTLTASGSVIGTPYFMSPEQGMGKMVSGASDQYSVGVMAYRMLAGKVPFEGDSAIDVLHKHCMVQPPPLETAAPGLPRHVYLAIHRALEKSPDRRFSNVRAFVEAMQDPNAMSAAAISLSGTGESDATLVVSAGQLSVSDLATTPMPSLGASIPPVAADTRTATRPPRPAPPPPKKRFPVGLVAGLLVVVIGAGGGTAYYLSTRGRVDNTSPRAPQMQAPQTQQTTPVTQPPASQTDQQQAPATRPPETQPTPQPQAQRPEPVTRPVAPAAPKTGTLFVMGLPQGGSIVIDNGRVVRNQTSVDLDPGSYRVTLAAPGYEAQNERVTITAGRTAPLTFSARTVQAPVSQPVQKPPEAQPTTPRELVAGQGILLLSVTPVAEVFIDSESHGIRSRYADTVVAGGHRIRLVPTDRTYADSSFTIEVKSGQNDPLRIQLRRQ
jgi:serine/threonine protein kinase